jgi:hypothetical protein
VRRLLPQPLGPQGGARLSEPYTKYENDVYGSGMIELDGQVRKLLDTLDRLGQANDTIVLFTTDNGAMATWWRDAGTTPFRRRRSGPARHRPPRSGGKSVGRSAGRCASAGSSRCDAGQGLRSKCCATAW